MQTSVINQDTRLALRVNDAVAISGLSRSSLYKLLANGKLRNVVVRGRRLFLREDILALLHDGLNTQPEHRATNGRTSPHKLSCQM
jgi:hypothetical protein